MHTHIVSGLLLAGLQFVLAKPPPSAHTKPFEHLKRQANGTSTADLQVDLGYAVYEGVSNESIGINYWKGIRYAAPPIGELRWQAPQAPLINRTNVISAEYYGSICPQSPNGGAPAPETYESEDCLFLNVWAPAGAKDLPVLVWIHGGMWYHVNFAISVNNS